MPTSKDHPGVYIEEIPSGVRPIAGVATSITAFVGAALRGPVNDPVTINGFGEFERLFGGLGADSMMSYAVQGFFENGGGQAIIVRLENGASAATITLPTAGAPPDDALALEAANVGLWGRDLRALVDHDTIDADASPRDPGRFNLVVYEEGGFREDFLKLLNDFSQIDID